MGWCTTHEQEKEQIRRYYKERIKRLLSNKSIKYDNEDLVDGIIEHYKNSGKINLFYGIDINLNALIKDIYKYDRVKMNENYGLIFAVNYKEMEELYDYISDELDLLAYCNCSEDEDGEIYCNEDINLVSRYRLIKRTIEDKDFTNVYGLNYGLNHSVSKGDKLLKKAIEKISDMGFWDNKYALESFEGDFTSYYGTIACIKFLILNNIYTLDNYKEKPIKLIIKHHTNKQKEEENSKEQVRKAIEDKKKENKEKEKEKVIKKKEEKKESKISKKKENKEKFDKQFYSSKTRKKLYKYCKDKLGLDVVYRSSKDYLLEVLEAYLTQGKRIKRK